MHRQASSYDFLFIIFSTIQRRCFNDYRAVCAHIFRVSRWFFVQSPIFAKFSNQVYAAFKVFWFFAISFFLAFSKLSTLESDFWDLRFSTLKRHLRVGGRPKWRIIPSFSKLLCYVWVGTYAAESTETRFLLIKNSTWRSGLGLTLDYETNTAVSPWTND